MLTVDTRSRCALVAAAFAVLLILRNPALAQCHYTYQLIPKPPGWIANPGLSMNNHGHVAGISHGGETHRVYTWSPETGNVILARPPGILSMESAFINDDGHVAGAMSSATTWYGYYWDGSTYTIIDLPDWAISLDVEGLNNNGQVVGTLSSGFPPLRAFIWQGGVFSDIGQIISEFSTHGEDIADSGTVVGHGYQELDPPLVERAFSLNGVSREWLPGPDGWWMSATGASGSGFIVGAQSAPAKVNPALRVLGAIWHDGTIETLAPPAGTRKLLMTAVNETGRAVGYYYDGLFPTNDSIVWHHGSSTSLTALLEPPPPWPVNGARAINRFGQILAGIGDSPAVLTPHWIVGDITGDCRVTLDDLAIVLTHFGSPLGSFPRGDVDLDGDVDLIDLSTVLSHWGI